MLNKVVEWWERRKKKYTTDELVERCAEVMYLASISLENATIKDAHNKFTINGKCKVLVVPCEEQ